MQAINSPNRHFIKQINIDSNAAHNIIDLETKGLLIIEQGSVLLETPANSQSLNEGDILYHKQGAYSLQLTETTSCKLLWISLDDNFLRSFIANHGTELSEIDRNEGLPSDIIKFNSSPLIEEIKSSLNTFVNNEYPDVIFSLRVSELLLLLSYSEQGALLLSNFRQLSSRQIERLQMFMENNYLKEWKLSEFARTFGMGLTTFKELFNTVYATSPRAWISEKRIMYAHQLLINTTMSIVEVSMEAGFSSQSYFTQTYRKRFGYTPSRSRIAA
ncbi:MULTISPECIES: helix-turn-helix transcriptional regulator [Providencia]|uniref:AraC family transcriptional regulator n=3 Tax=Morganellaceae TaxID=1903414 RepID=A0A264VQU5_PRORE|nr:MULTISPECIES: AraC family transcriptional regulator [Providencia]MBG5892338.1 helix-turn-helix transcriptional regulator [Providencia rettgeri]MBQ0528444.1 helix-turn-helix transcriptional regulator [Providencia rettgeri]MDI9094471.1 AraC family transcriptional regulator [Providencia rettgeri]MDT2035417.1 AraC family transcriptional regulator [Providencia rettgeri]OZS73652.1 AraC family transcriptional regulator [Providencia rettgeri]